MRHLCTCGLLVTHLPRLVEIPRPCSGRSQVTCLSGIPAGHTETDSWSCGIQAHRVGFKRVLRHAPSFKAQELHNMPCLGSLPASLSLGSLKQDQNRVAWRAVTHHPSSPRQLPRLWCPASAGLSVRRPALSRRLQEQLHRAQGVIICCLAVQKLAAPIEIPRINKTRPPGRVSFQVAARDLEPSEPPMRGGKQPIPWQAASPPTVCLCRRGRRIPGTKCSGDS
ncbi:hypothetical protein VTI74DRAFT_3165 [Chaetomium olivicolor]